MNKKQWIPLLLTVVMLFSAAYAEETLGTIMNTGTTQAFTMDAIPADDIDIILAAGLNAASAINQQPWHLVAVTNPDVMTDLGGSMTPSADMAPPADMADIPADASSGAPAGDSSGAPADMPQMPASTGAKAALGDSPLAILVYKLTDTMSPNPDFDCGLACQNMVLAANALGYGAKIVSAPTMTLNGENHDAICEQLGIDTSLQAVAVVLIGTPDADTVSTASVRKTIEEKVTYVQ